MADPTFPFLPASGHRRALRRRGLCPHCAYELAGITTCPECGKTASGAMAQLEE